MKHLGSKTLETTRLIIKKDKEKDKPLLWKYIYSDKEAVKKCDWVDFNKEDYK